MTTRWVGALLLAAWTGLASSPQEGRARIPIVLDADFGSGLDDAFALGLALTSPEVEVKGVTTSGGDVQARSLLVCRLLSAVDRKGIPVASGHAPPAPRSLGALRPYSAHPDAAYNRTQRPVKEGAADFLYARLKERPGEVTLVCLGPLTNIARLLADHPDAKPWVKRLILPADFRPDVAAAKAVLASGIPLVAVSAYPAERGEAGLRDMVFEARTPLTRQLQTLYQMANEETPAMSDLARVAAVFQGDFFETEPARLGVDDRGDLQTLSGEPNGWIARPTDLEMLLCWGVDRLGTGRDAEPAPKPAPVNVSSLVARGAMPYRVHVAEDFETDIERRWWMSGVPETINIPPGSLRACRGVLTHDFDDLMGARFKEMYTAVIFNPVPGPPMGKRTRLSFRYWLRGTDTMRVQIYSLSNGYHRHLTLTGLPEGRWEEGAVDMTAARRPNGSGGPLSEGERIDDLQFYVHADAELLIDDIVLYDAAPPEETRPFPKRIHFPGVFDTGKQGKEWPGTFDLALPGVPPTAKAARSVPSTEHGAPWIRLHLRGERPVGETTALSFRYRLTGADSMRVSLVERPDGKVHTVELKGLFNGDWPSAAVEFAGGPRAGARTDELRFLVPPGAELRIDDVLLYEPGVAR